MVAIHGKDGAYSNSRQKDIIRDYSDQLGVDIGRALDTSMYGKYIEYISEYFKPEQLEEVKEVDLISRLYVNTLKESHIEIYNEFKDMCKTDSGRDVVTKRLLNSINVEDSVKILNEFDMCAIVDSKNKLHLANPRHKTNVVTAILLNFMGKTYREHAVFHFIKGMNFSADDLKSTETTESLALAFYLCEYFKVNLSSIMGVTLNPDTLLGSNHLYFPVPDVQGYCTMLPIRVSHDCSEELVRFPHLRTLYSGKILQTLDYSKGFATLSTGERLSEYLKKL